MRKGNYTRWRIFAPLIATALVAGAYGLTNKTPEAKNRRIAQESKIESVIEKEYAGNAQKAESQKKENYETTDFSADSDEVLLARMLFGEARNCSDEEMIDIAYTAINRTKDGKKWNGETLREVILKPWQYSCFNSNDVNRKKLMNPEKYDSKSWERCLKIAHEVLTGKYGEKNRGATHYFAKNIRKPKWADSPKMTDIPEPEYYKHDFYREK